MNHGTDKIIEFLLNDYQLLTYVRNGIVFKESYTSAKC